MVLFFRFLRRLAFFKPVFFYCGGIFLYTLSFVICSCGNVYNTEIWGNSNGVYGYETVFFELPVWDEDGNYPPLDFWILRVSSLDYSEELKISRDTSIVPVTVRKNEPFAILAFPVNRIFFKNTSNGDKDDWFCSQFFKPAGAVYPYGSEKLSWEQGFCAYIMTALWNCRRETSLSDGKINDFIASFNWKKFQESIDKKLEESFEYYKSCEVTPSKAFYNPWQCNIQSLLENLSFGQFKASLLTPKTVYAVPSGLADSNIVLSSFIPENTIINNYKFCAVQKNELNNFMCSNHHLACISYVSAKNISVSYIQMPIYIE